MSFYEAAIQVTIGYVVMFGVAAVFFCLIMPPSYAYGREAWAYYRKQRRIGYSRKEAFSMAIDFLSWRI